MIGCHVIYEAVAVALVGHGIAGVLESYSDAVDVLGYKEEQTHGSPCEGPCFASLAHAVDALYGVAGVTLFLDSGRLGGVFLPGGKWDPVVLSFDRILPTLNSLRYCRSR